MVGWRKYAFRAASEWSEAEIEKKKNIENNKVEETSFISLYVAWVLCTMATVHGEYQIQKKKQQKPKQERKESRKSEMNLRVATNFIAPFYHP